MGISERRRNIDRIAEGALETGIDAAANVFRSIDSGLHEAFDAIMNDAGAPGVFDTSLGDRNSPSPYGKSPDASGPKYQLPIHAKRMDHYTLICQDAKRVANLHTKALGFVLDSIKPINSGTVAENEVDMLNYIMHPPSNKDLVMVVTEGLNDDTIFRKYMKNHGPGVHHIAFEVDDVDAAFAAIKRAGITTCSDQVTTDMISGLKQLFIPPTHAGFFVELIERPKKIPSDCRRMQSKCDASKSNFFANSSMINLAQSISNFVEIKHDNAFAHEKEEDNDDSSVVSTTSGIGSIGEIAAVEISVENVDSSASFLIDVLNFRMLRHTGERVYLSLPGSSITIVVAMAASKKEERDATVMFNAPQLTKHTATQLPPASHHICLDGVEGLVLSDQYFSCKVLFASPVQLSQQRKVVKYDDDTAVLSVHIRSSMNDVARFLARPTNLAYWTGHRFIHFSDKLNSWVETRTAPNGQLKDYRLGVKVEEGSGVTVRFIWPEREVDLLFVLTEIAPRYCEVTVALPSSKCFGELRLSRMRRILCLELDLLKAIMEGNVQDAIPLQTFHHIQSYHLSMYGFEVKNILPEEAADQYKLELVRSGSILDMMSTDFALTITSKPQAVIVPMSVRDIQAAVRMATYYNIPLCARGSKVSHSAGGQAQANGGLILDMSGLSSVDIIDDNSAVKVGPGAFWDKVIRATLERGLMPPVINDYQYLSVGGTLSMGGVGFMSHQLGVQAAYVREMDVVTGQGDAVTCNSDENVDLFDCMRGGLGQCGIITSVTLPLVPAPKQISLFKLFYRASDVQAFTEDVKQFVETGKVDMIHAFLKPCNLATLTKIVGDDSMAASSEDFKHAIAAGESRGDLVFFLELGCYMRGSPRDEEHLSAMAELLSSGSRCICTFNEIENFQAYITKDPPVVETNAAHGSIPHPSFATMIGEEHVVRVLEHHINSSDRGNDDLNEILIIPAKSNEALKKGHHTPMFPLPSDSDLSFFLLFLGSVVAPESEPGLCEEIMKGIRDHHRSLYQLSNSLGAKRYSYCTITSEVSGESEWRNHYGGDAWEQLRAAKRKYDPYHLFCPGVKMWD